MRKWTDVKKNLKSLSEYEKYRLDTMSKLIGSMLKERNLKKVTYTQLSKATGIEEKKLYEIDTFEKELTLEDLLKIAFALRLDLKLE